MTDDQETTDRGPDREAQQNVRLPTTRSREGQSKRVFHPSLPIAEHREPGEKQWLQSPLVGPGHLRCFRCGHDITTGYFAVLLTCPECGGAP